MDPTQDVSSALRAATIATIEHMSREIDALSAGALAFRTRTAFTVWLGPYFILGSIVVATRGNFVLPDLSSIRSLLYAFALIYVTLGVLSGYIERHYWKQVIKFRVAIAALGGSMGLDCNEVHDALGVEHYRYLIWNYVIVFLLILASFAVVAVLASKVTPSMVTPSIVN